MTGEGMPQLRSALEDRFGTPARVAEFRVQHYRIDVLKWDPATMTDGVNLYVTVGASGVSIGDAEEAHRAEFLVGLLPGRDEIASSLAALGLYQAREHVAVRPGDTVPSDTPLWPSTTMRHFLIARPLSDTFIPIQQGDDVPIHLLQALPVFEAEVAFNAGRGRGALLRRWRDTNVRFWDPDREPSC
jgi:suppressor of fused protein SUFU